MAVAFETYVAADADYGSGSGNLSVSPPTGLAAGDLWVISCTNDSNPNEGQIGLATNFTAISAEMRFNDGTNDVYPTLRSQWKIAGASESAVTVPFSAGSWEVHARSQRYSDPHQTAPIGNVSTLTGTSGLAGGSGEQTIDVANLTIQADGSMAVLFAGAHVGVVGPISAPIGSTQIDEKESQYTSFTLSYEARNAGTYNPNAFTFGSGGSQHLNLVAQVFEIRPSSSGSPPHARAYGPQGYLRTLIGM